MQQNKDTTKESVLFLAFSMKFTGSTVDQIMDTSLHFKQDQPKNYKNAFYKQKTGSGTHNFFYKFSRFFLKKLIEKLPTVLSCTLIISHDLHNNTSWIM